MTKKAAKEGDGFPWLFLFFSQNLYKFHKNTCKSIQNLL